MKEFRQKCEDKLNSKIEAKQMAYEDLRNLTHVHFTKIQKKV